MVHTEFIGTDVRLQWVINHGHEVQS